MKTLGPLMSDSFAIYKKFFSSILIGAVVLGIVGGVVRLGTGRWMMSQLPVALEQSGFDESKIKDLQMRIQQGDKQASEELAREMGNLIGSQLGRNGSFLGSFLGVSLRGIIVSAIISWLIWSIAFAYFILIPTKGASPSIVWEQTGHSILPMLGLNLWLFVRSFVWIPILGIIVAIIIGPRLSLAPVILVTEKKGVFESASLSYQRTRGWWDKIVGNTIVVCLVVGIIGTTAAGFLRIFGSTTGELLGGIVSMLTMAYYAIFLHELSATLSTQAKSA